MKIDGSAFDDILDGTDRDDVINGYAGDDTISGKAGNDVIYGGEGNDRIDGGSGNDVLDGGSGTDFIYDWDGGSDTLRGGAGDDTISIVHFGSGSKIEAAVVEGGAGNDQVTFRGSAFGTATIDLGDGDDRFSLGYIPAGAQVTVTTGTGRDTITIEEFSLVGSKLVVTDFVTGNAGDTFDIGNFLGQTAVNWNGANPFGSGQYLRLRQSNGAVLVELDRDGSAGSSFAYTTIVRFENTVLAAFSAANFGGYDPSGAPVIGAVVEGTAVSDKLTGSAGPDIITGLGGNDTIYGLNGNDVIDGGAGADVIYSGYGNDTVDGGEGNDVIRDSGGSDILRGGAGNDVISWIDSSGLNTNTVQIDAGMGDDTVSLSAFSYGTATINMGDGADTVDLGNSSGIVRVSLGAGRDNVQFGGFLEETTAAIITDFKSGPDGDNIDIAHILSFDLSFLEGRNPFALGYLRLVQSGQDTLLQIDLDGVGRDEEFHTFGRLEGVVATSLVSTNIGGFVPKVGALTDPKPEEIIGTEYGDDLPGGGRDDVIRGLGGDDFLLGFEGRDVLEGGEGNDILMGDLGGGDADSDVFLFAGKRLGADRIEDFGMSDLLVTTSKLADRNRDKIIDFGSDRDLDFTGGGHAVIYTDTGDRLTRLEYDGSFVSDNVTYYVYSRVGSAVGVSDADALI